MVLKVAGVTIVNSAANVQTTTLPNIGITDSETFGNTSHVISANLSNRGLVQTITSARVDATAIKFKDSANNTMENQTIFVSTSTPSGGANGDIWYQTYS